MIRVRVSVRGSFRPKNSTLVLESKKKEEEKKKLVRSAINVQSYLAQRVIKQCNWFRADRLLYILEL